MVAHGSASDVRRARDIMTATFAWFIAIVGVLSVIRAMWRFDSLVRWQYEHLREQWRAMASHMASFRSEKETSGRRSETANSREMLYGCSERQNGWRFPP